MGDSWRFRHSNQDDIFEGDDPTNNRNNERVKKSHSKNRDEEDVGRHSSKRNKDERHKDHDHEQEHRHSHKSHRSEKRHKKRSKRSRSRSRSRDRSRSKDREQGSRDSRRHHDRDRNNHPSSSRTRFPDADRYSQSGRDFRRQGHSGPIKSSGDNSKDDDIDDRCPSSLLKPVPPEAARLKEEVERRKRLWGKKDKPVESAAVPAAWSKTAFSDDSDGKVSAKFKRLMGMKDGESSSIGPCTKEESAAQNSDASNQKQAEFLANLEKQYEVARATTHTQRGLGLGFSSSRILHR